MVDEGQLPARVAHVLQLMGAALLVVQTAERVLQTTLRFAFPANGEMNLGEIEGYDGKTLGFFIARLKERVVIDDDLEIRLASFLSARNTFAHDVRRVTGFDLDEEAGLDVAEAFCTQLIESAIYVTGILTVVLLEWQRQVSMEIPAGPAKEYLREIEKTYGDGALSHFLANKPTPPASSRRRKRRSIGT